MTRITNCLNKCDRCCRYIKVRSPQWDSDYLLARGLSWEDGYLEIPHLCPQLENHKCKLKNRPKICIEFLCKEANENSILPAE